MNRILKFGLVTVAGLVVLFGTGCDKLRSRDQLNKGVQAYKNAKYAEAIDNFKTAIALDPNGNADAPARTTDRGIDAAGWPG